MNTFWENDPSETRPFQSHDLFCENVFSFYKVCPYSSIRELCLWLNICCQESSYHDKVMY